MAKHYPRSYVVVKSGQIAKVTVKDAVQETALILKHSEATGTNPVTKPTFSNFVIPDTKSKK